MDAIPPLLARPARLWRDKNDFFRPFRNAARSTGTEQADNFRDTSAISAASEDDSETAKLNEELHVLLEVFPDVPPEVFRDMLASMGPESRVAVITEHVLRKNKKTTEERKRRVVTRRHEKSGRRLLAREDHFRGDAYHEAVKKAFYQEFRSLNHSTIKGVMAENNGSYTRSRPVLQHLASQTWRSSLANLWSRRNTQESIIDHPALLWQGGSAGISQAQPIVKTTGSAQLDQELHDLFIKPYVEKAQQDQMYADQAFALELNEAEALEAKAVYDCECCYASVAFEQIMTCSSGEHFLCYDCIRKTAQEALYGQGWARSADLEKSTIRCFAPALQECQASLPSKLVGRALQQDKQSVEVWSAFQTRITSETLLKSRAALQRCPFCFYAEVAETPTPSIRIPQQIHTHIHRRLRPLFREDVSRVLAFLFMPLLVIPVFTGLLLLSSMLALNTIRQTLGFPRQAIPATMTTALAHVYRQQLGPKFKCRNSACGRVSCSRCAAEWQDPHVCFENEKTSLRTAVEASATAAIKRTCPRCLLSFVKASGCNKLVCNCGYTMCYVCRKEITSKEGYAHFCQHFRPHGGSCSECDRCDLYGDEDEETAIRKAIEVGERQWREREAAKTKAAIDPDQLRSITAMVDAVAGTERASSWTEHALEILLDATVTFN